MSIERQSDRERKTTLSSEFPRSRYGFPLSAAVRLAVRYHRPLSAYLQSRQRDRSPTALTYASVTTPPINRFAYLRRSIHQSFASDTTNNFIVQPTLIHNFSMIAIRDSASYIFSIFSSWYRRCEKLTLFVLTFIGRPCNSFIERCFYPWPLNLEPWKLYYRSNFIHMHCIFYLF